MNLQDLVDELRENILHDRSDRVSGTPDYLWSDATLVRYINEAQRRFARESLIIRDGTSEATTVTLETGVDRYALHPSILGVLSVRVSSDTADLARAGHSALDTYHQADAYFFDPSSLSVLAPGKPVAYSTDDYLGTDDFDSVAVPTLRLYPTPSSAYNGKTLRLRVVRLPLEDLTVRNMRATPEIPQDHHIEMLDWAAYLALRIVDADGGMPDRAAEFKKSFDESVFKARQSSMRKLFSPALWGFGRNAWAWER